MNQKDYLKKYLSIGKDTTEKKKKKRKVKSNVAPSRLIIIDDNADTFQNAVKEDLLEDEDAPQIVAVIDDRPPSLRVDEKSNTNLWIPIGSNNDNSFETSENKTDLGDLSPPRNRTKRSSTANENDDISPPRKRKFHLKKNSDEYGEISEQKEDMSPIRKDSSSSLKMLNEDTNNRQKSEERDISPPRRRNKDRPLEIENRKKSSRWGSRSRETSPSPLGYKDVKLEKKYSEDDNSPPRRNNDVSTKKMLNEDVTNRQKSEERDISPPRRRNKDRLLEIENKKKTSRWENRSIEESPSPLSCKDVKKEKICSDDDNSPPRRKNDISAKKMVKTLDGKTAGLQDAKQLAAESRLIKEKEREHFDQMSSEVSGVNAKTVFRDKKTSRVRDFQEETARDLEKKKREDENKEKYSRWGRGLKQVEDATKRREEELNEMSKPLARYANDEDLERHLKEQEREGDPMLAYIRKKKKKKDIEEGKPIKPEYMGEFMPNRFGIRPGHRWDGVDRSNGYEKKWFDNQNAKMAQQEEVNRWNTEDM